MPRIDLTPRYFHRFVSSHGQLYLSLVPGRGSRVRSIIKFRSNLQAHNLQQFAIQRDSCFKQKDATVNGIIARSSAHYTF